MLDLYSSALKLVEDRFDRGYPGEQTIIFRLAETYEAIALVQKKLSGLENKENIQSNEEGELLPAGSRTFQSRKFEEKIAKSGLEKNTPLDQEQAKEFLKRAESNFYKAYNAYSAILISSPTKVLCNFMEHLDCKVIIVVSSVFSNANRTR